MLNQPKSDKVELNSWRASRGRANSICFNLGSRERGYSDWVLLTKMQALQFVSWFCFRGGGYKLRLAQHCHGKCGKWNDLIYKDIQILWLVLAWLLYTVISYLAFHQQRHTNFVAGFCLVVVYSYLAFNQQNHGVSCYIILRILSISCLRLLYCASAILFLWCYYW